VVNLGSFKEECGVKIRIGAALNDIGGSRNAIKSDCSYTRTYIHTYIHTCLHKCTRYKPDTLGLS